MSWNDGEVTVIPHEIKKPSYANRHWKKSWKANYKGEDFYITKAPKGHYGENDGYEVRWKWKGRHPKNDNTDIIPELIDLHKLKTMPQVKKLIRTFVDGINNGKLVDVETGKPLTFNTFDTCTACSIFAGIPNLYHRQNMFTHKALWDKNEWDKKPYQCKWHTKLDVLEAMKEDKDKKLEDVDKMDIYAYKRKIESQINLLKKKGKEIDVDALVPDSELIQMSNPYLEMARRRRGLEAEGEEEGYWSPKELRLIDYAARRNDAKKPLMIAALWEIGLFKFATMNNMNGSVNATISLNHYERTIQKPQYSEMPKANQDTYYLDSISRKFATKIAMCHNIDRIMRRKRFKEKSIPAEEYVIINYQSDIYKDDEILFAMKNSEDKKWLKYKYDNKTGVGRWGQSKRIVLNKKREYDTGGEYVIGNRGREKDFRKRGDNYTGNSWLSFQRTMPLIYALNTKSNNISKMLWEINPEFFYNILIKLEPSMKDDFKWVNTKKNVRLQMARRRRGLEAEEIATNPLLWTGATVIALLSYFKSN